MKRQRNGKSKLGMGKVRETWVCYKGRWSQRFAAKAPTTHMHMHAYIIHTNNLKTNQVTLEAAARGLQVKVILDN